MFLSFISIILDPLQSGREIPALLREKVSRNELGVKSGKGWLDYGGKTREQIMERINRLLLQKLRRCSPSGNRKIIIMAGS